MQANGQNEKADRRGGGNASPGGRPASNDSPSLRAGGNSNISAGMVARAAACEAISAQTTACALGRLASAPTRSKSDIVKAQTP